MKLKLDDYFKNKFTWIKNHKLISLICFFIFILVLTLLSPFWINLKSNQKIYSKEDVPERKVAIVFGAAVFANKWPSDVVEDRVKVAADLYKVGKVEKILMTGDNSVLEYNEPEVMRKAALELGVKNKDIILDFAGFRTYDSCERAKRVFKIDEAILVTQKGHLQRAIYLCEKSGIKSAGVSASIREYKYENRQSIREWVAKMATFWEANVFRHDPKFLGEEESL
jgi:vancomycin permeability regulator SanA